MMSRDLKAFVSNFFSAIDRGDWDQLQELMHPNHSFSFPMAAERLNREAHIELNRNFQMSFSDFEHVIKDQIAEGDKVVTRGVVRAKHTGEFNGIAPTGKSVEFEFINIMRLVDGLNREEWLELNGLKLMQQIGANVQ